MKVILPKYRFTVLFYLLWVLNDQFSVLNAMLQLSCKMFFFILSQGLFIFVFYLLLDKTVSNLHHFYGRSPLLNYFYCFKLRKCVEFCPSGNNHLGKKRIQERVHAMEDW